MSPAFAEKGSEIICGAVGVKAAPIAPSPAFQVKTWKMAEGVGPVTLSTKAIFFPLSERTGEVSILPGPVEAVLMLEANSTFRPGPFGGSHTPPPLTGSE